MPDDPIEPWEVLDLLAHLVDKSLVVYEVDEQGAARYRLLETVRRYARDRLDEAGEAPPARERHAAHHLALAEAAEPHLRGPEQALWLARLELEHDNLRASLDWWHSGARGLEPSPAEEPAPEPADPAERELCLAARMTWFWFNRGYLREGRERLAAALAATPPRPARPARELALSGAGVLAWRSGDYDAARVLHTESLAAARELGDRTRIAFALNNLGILATQQGDYEAARTLLQESLDLAHTLGDWRAVAKALVNLSLNARFRGDLAAARALNEEALPLVREMGDRLGLASLLNNHGSVLRALDEFAAARPFYDEARRIREEVGDRIGTADSLASLGALAYREGDTATARSYYEASISMARELGHPPILAPTLGNLSNLLVEEGELEPAGPLLQECLQVYVKMGSAAGLAACLHSLGRLALTAGTPRRAAVLFGAAEGRRVAAGAPPEPPEGAEQWHADLANLRNTLGEERWQASHAAGRAMSAEGAVEYACAPPEAE